MYYFSKNDLFYRAKILQERINGLGKNVQMIKKNDSEYLVKIFSKNCIKCEQNTFLTKISIKITVKKAPIGSIKDKAPLIIPIELPKKKEARNIIIRNEYLLQGLSVQDSNRLIRFIKLRFKLVD